jgi:hypothetical protein
VKDCLYFTNQFEKTKFIQTVDIKIIESLLEELSEKIGAYNVNRLLMILEEI